MPSKHVMLYMCFKKCLSVCLSSKFYSNQPKGGWSNEGILQDNDPTSPVMCNSTHLTSFAVLVSAEGGHDFQVWL